MNIVSKWFISSFIFKIWTLKSLSILFMIKTRLK